ncbi:ATP-binding cassette domain-containing protein [Spongisporangium articulatum]|uniref:ATP-binding cassette domain-containing protein n=1 Tax=Spongisporangium articulatum TaxID=3362603 RepID=A0ABW8APT8_9ACTN
MNAPTEDPPVPQIEVVGVGKTFSVRTGWRGRRSVTALHDLSFVVEAGEAVGVVGGPGSGKSTLARIVAGQFAPSAGFVRTAGLLPVRQRADLTRVVGALLAGDEDAGLPGDLSLARLLPIVAEARGLATGEWQLRRDELAERLALGPHLNRPYGQLDDALRLRACLAVALLHRPPLLILDDVLDGPDAVGRDLIRGLLRHEHRVGGCTLLLSAASVSALESSCRRLLVLDGGRLVHDGPLPDLVERAGAQRILVIDLTEAAGRLDSVPNAEVLEVEADGRRQRLLCPPGRTATADVLADVADRLPPDVRVRDVTVLEPALDDVLARLREV